MLRACPFGPAAAKLRAMADRDPQPPMRLRDRVADALGLHRPDLRAWAMYDWGISAYETTIVTAIFPIYFAVAAAEGLEDSTASAYMAFANSVTILLVAIVSPLLGAMADYAAVKKKLLAVFMAGGALATAAMFLIHTGHYVLALVLFVAAGVGAQGSRVFYESLLPHIAEPRMDPTPRSLRTPLGRRAHRCSGHASHPTHLPLGGGVVGPLLHPALQEDPGADGGAAGG